MRKIAIDSLIALGLFVLLLQAYTEATAERLFSQGEAFLQSGQPELALVKYRDALEITPNRYQILRALGEAGLKSYSPSLPNFRPLLMAEAALRQATEDNPIYPYAWFELAVVAAQLQKAGAPEGVNPDKLFRRALEIDPQNPRFLAGFMLRQLDSGLRLAAWETFRQLIDSEPTAILTYGDKFIHDQSDVERLERELRGDPVRTVSLSRLLYQRSEFRHSEELIRSLPADRQTDPEAASLLASALRRQGRMDEAEKVLRNARARNPNNLYLVRDLGVLLGYANKGRESVEVFRQALAAHPGELWLQLEAANTAKNTKEWDAAADWYESALDTHKLDEKRTREALIGLGEVRRQQGRLRPALIIYEQLLEMEPDNRKFKDTVDQLQLELERQAPPAE